MVCVMLPPKQVEWPEVEGSAQFAAIETEPSFAPCEGPELPEGGLVEVGSAACVVVRGTVARLVNVDT
jgi:hypothetical protein